jgi:hypothetical protein
MDPPCASSFQTLPNAAFMDSFDGSPCASAA